jgi:hypothetical protein
MKKIYNIPLFLLICLVISLGIVVTSCKKDTVVNSGVVELLSFGPSGVKPGDQIKLIGKNLDKVTEIKVVGDSIESTSFVEQTSELIVIVVPQKTERGLITLKTTDGNIVSKTVLDLLVPVTITLITDSVRPGDNITITGTYMNWISEVWFTKDILVTEFVSKSLTELVVKVPLNAKTGPLVLNTKGTKPLSINPDKDLVVVLPSITSFGPIPVDRGADLTITGANLDLTKQVLLKGVTDPITEFVSKSATQLVIKVPMTTTKGKITLVAYSLIAVESTANLLIVGDLPDLAPLAYAIYEDALVNGWQDWGWSRTADYINADNVRDGVASIKLIYTGNWGALKFANASVSTAIYSELTFSIFGTPGTGGKKLHVQPSGGANYTITIEEGKWVEYKLTKDQIGNPATITDLLFQCEDWVGTIYFDQVGLR